VGQARVAEFEAERSWLLGIAYRMLGEVQEAEDAVQDAYLRWTAADRSDIESPRAWLTKAVTNLCLNRLTSAQARRETYPGPWLPEPVLTGPAALTLGPLETVEQRDTVSLALLTLMERLTPAERAVFVLREAFGYPHREISQILDISDPASRKLHHRARQRVGEPHPRYDTDPGQVRRLVERFLAATLHGDLAGLADLLAQDVTSWSDGGGKARAARRPVHGRDKVARLVVALAGNADTGINLVVEEVNGGPGIIGRMEETVVIVVAIEVGSGQITALHSVLNPDKLSQATHK